MQSSPFIIVFFLIFLLLKFPFPFCIFFILMFLPLFDSFPLSSSLAASLNFHAHFGHPYPLQNTPSYLFKQYLSFYFITSSSVRLSHAMFDFSLHFANFLVSGLANSFYYLSTVSKLETRTFKRNRL